MHHVPPSLHVGLINAHKFYIVLSIFTVNLAWNISHLFSGKPFGVALPSNYSNVAKDRLVVWDVGVQSNHAKWLFMEYLNTFDLRYVQKQLLYRHVDEPFSPCRSRSLDWVQQSSHKTSYIWSILFWSGCAHNLVYMLWSVCFMVGLCHGTASDLFSCNTAHTFKIFVYAMNRGGPLHM